MRLVIARCSVDYTGRLSAHLPLATRLLLVKADGSVLVHSDGGAYKPLNWMSAPCTLVQEPDAWRVSNRTGESMTIQIEEILHDSSHNLGVDPGLVKDGVERHLQVAAQLLQALDLAPVDLLCRDDQGAYVAVEIKRRGGIEGLEQLGRYLERLRPALGAVRGVLAAQAFTQQARTLAASRGINCVALDYDALRGMEPNTPTLF